MLRVESSNPGNRLKFTNPGLKGNPAPGQRNRSEYLKFLPQPQTHQFGILCKVRLDSLPSPERTGACTSAASLSPVFLFWPALGSRRIFPKSSTSPLKPTVHSTCFIWSPFLSPRPLMQPLDLGLSSPLPTNTSCPKPQCYKQGSAHDSARP